ncbi:hypothetical protein [Riemerella columbina]|uniref:hypothetical protein n=1 Tax=Riemerella columbina TaxID=103810 RepID=UPI0003805D0B|nr:hypothetical protein [Riemerella columbina]
MNEENKKQQNKGTILKEALEKVISDAKESYKQSAEQNRDILEFLKKNIDYINQSGNKISEVVNHLVIFNNKTLIDADKEVERIRVGLNEFKGEFIGETERKVKDVISEIPSEIVLETRLHSLDRDSIDNLNKRLNIPKYSVYMFVAGVVMMIISGLFMYFSFKSNSKSVQQIRTEYVKELNEEGILLVRKEEQDLSKEIFEWMNINPKTKIWFEKWRKKRK